MKSDAEKTFQCAVESWFLSWLMGHRKLSPQTICSYRDTFKLLIRWLKEEKDVAPSDITFDDIDRDGIMNYINWLATARNNSSKTVNCRLGAIRSFANYVACEYPERSAWARSITSIKGAKEARPELDYLTPSEVNSLIESCDNHTPEGRRDSMMVKLLFNSGFRVSELIELRRSSFLFAENGCRVTVVGKGRKARTVPLWRDTASAVREYIEEHGIVEDGYLFPGRNVEHLSRSGARARLDLIVDKATKRTPSLKEKKVGMHTLRHSTAMAMLAAGVDISTIAMWLGHESIQTTHRYMVADMEMKERALAKALDRNPFNSAVKSVPYKPEDGLLAFLSSL